MSRRLSGLVGRTVGAATLIVSLAIASAPSPAAAQGTQDFANLATSLSAVVEGLNGTLDTLPEALESAVKSEAEATRYFDTIAKGGREAVEALREDGEIWRLVLALDEQIQTNIDGLEDRYQDMGQQRFRALADEWRTRSDRLAQIRQSIISERARAEQSLEALSADREYVIELIKLQMTDTALAELEKVQHDMTEMNNKMAELQSQADALAPGGVAN